MLRTMVDCYLDIIFEPVGANHRAVCDPTIQRSDDVRSLAQNCFHNPVRTIDSSQDRNLFSRQSSGQRSPASIAWRAVFGWIVLLPTPMPFIGRPEEDLVSFDDAGNLVGL